MTIFLFIILLIVGIGLIIHYMRQDNGAFMSPCLVTLMTVFSICPQLFSLFVSRYVDQSILPMYILTVLLSILSFHYGFKFGMQRIDSVIVEDTFIKDIEVTKNKGLILACTLCGIFALLVYKGLFVGLDFVVGGFFQSMGVLALLLSIVAIRELDWKKAKLYLIPLLVNFWCVYDYAVNVKGSRTRIFYMLVWAGMFLTSVYPLKKKIINKAFISVFIIGSVMSFSIGDYRTQIYTGKDVNAFSIENVIDNYEKMLSGSNKLGVNGNDLYNGARYVNHCWENFEYNYGTSIWNGAVFYYVPSRFVGKEIKESLMIKLENRDYIKKLTNSVTTTTGFADAFAIFNFFGCFFFFIVGAFQGKWWHLSKYSQFYFVLYSYSIMYIAQMISHGIVYYTSPMLMWLILLYPLIKNSVEWKKISID